MIVKGQSHESQALLLLYIVCTYHIRAFFEKWRQVSYNEFPKYLAQEANILVNETVHSYLLMWFIYFINKCIEKFNIRGTIWMRKPYKA